MEVGRVVWRDFIEKGDVSFICFVFYLDVISWIGILGFFRKSLARIVIFF